MLDLFIGEQIFFFLLTFCLISKNDCLIMRNEDGVEIFGWTDDGELKNELSELLHKYDETQQVHGGINSKHRCASCRDET